SGEMIAPSSHHTVKIPMTGLRFFTVYGPWGRPDMAYYSFTKAILEDQPITVYHQGLAKRDFTYIDDIIYGTIQAIDTCTGYEIFNLGNNRPESVNTLIDILENLLNKKAERIEKPLPSGDIATTYADLTKSSRFLNYTPTTSLQSGLEKFVQWYLYQVQKISSHARV
ncbi:MAG: NAD-dependent epimerase/dehydratase family protein, partial [Chlamydiales bacterium]|nr:NAD-dependent epimerase/dehydratase family protein [Chlamydiales bacterium]